MGVKTGPGEAEALTLELRGPLCRAVPLGDHTSLAVGFTYKGTGLNFDDTAAGFPLFDSDLHELSFPILVRHELEGSPWSLRGALTPGIATDFGHIDGDDFFLGGRLGFERVVNERFKFGIGAAVIRNLGNESLLPALGLQWRPSEAWLVDLAGPFLSVWWQPDEAWLVRFGAGPSGGVWNTGWNGLSRDLSMSSYLVGAGFETRLNDGLWFTVNAGVSLGNHLELGTTGGLTTFKTGLDEGLFISFGLRLAAW